MSALSNYDRFMTQELREVKWFADKGKMGTLDYINETGALMKDLA